MTSLAEEAGRGPVAQQTDKHYAHDYMPAYEAHLPPRDQPVRLLEIGVQQGNSLDLWDRWFTHPDTEIVGLDVISCDRVIGPRVKVVRIDAKQYRPRPDEKFDVIIDDGSHDADDIVPCLNRLWQHVGEGGLYVVEDLAVQTSVGNTCLARLAECAYPLLVNSRQREISEVHVYPEIWFMRRRGAAV